MGFAGTIIYLHGFRSSSQSVKARMVRQYIDDQVKPFGGELFVPDLGFDVERAIAHVESKLEHLPAPFAFIGSSLGGYYASYLAERSKVVLERSPHPKVVLINPSVRPFELLQHYLGVVKSLYSDETFELKMEHMSVLKKYYVEQIIAPERYYLLVKTHDEVLDYWQAVTHYRGCNALISAGGDHGFEDLNQYLDSVFTFIGLNSTKPTSN